MHSQLTWGTWMLLNAVCYGLAMLIPIVLSKSRRLSFFIPLSVFSILLAGICGIAAAWVGSNDLYVSFSPPWGSFMRTELALNYRIDGLARFFGFLISTFSVVTSIYSFSYLSKDGISKSKGIDHKKIAYVPVSFALFLLSMTQIVYTDNIVLFILSWEVMTISSSAFAYFKQIYLSNEHNQSKKEARTTLIVYLIFGQISTILIVVGFSLVQPVVQSDIYYFNVFSSILSTKPSSTRFLVFILLLSGFGIKSAMIPFHVWLPFLNFSSPGNAHALHSSIMVKIGLYGIFRLLFDFFFPAEWWMGATVLIFGAVSVVAGVQYAVAEHDLKKALAYHTIENVGIILIGLGVAAMVTENAPGIAAFALVAALFHVLNHALFKGALLLSVGEIELRAKSVHLDRLGGLFQSAPLTAAPFLVGALAIAGIPPLNGFASEWLTFQSLIAASQNLHHPVQLAAILIGFASLAYGCAGTALCFAKICGLILFGSPRKEYSPPSTKTGIPKLPGLKLGPGLLAVACIILGLWPGLGYGIISQSISDMFPLGGELLFALQKLGNGCPWNGLPYYPSKGFPISPSEEFLRVIRPFWLGVVLIIVLTVVYLWFKRRPLKDIPVWNCGSPHIKKEMQANASQLSGFFLENAFFVQKRIDSNEKETNKNENETLLPVISRSPDYTHWERFRYLYGKMADHLVKVSDKIAIRIQNGDLRWYVGYLLSAMFAVFVFFLIWR